VGKNCQEGLPAVAERNRTPSTISNEELLPVPYQYDRVLVVGKLHHSRL
jgi:hypothetical protein